MPLSEQPQVSRKADRLSSDCGYVLVGLVFEIAQVCYQGVEFGRIKACQAEIEALLGTPVYLDLHVKIAKDWQRDPRQLRKLGF